MATIVITGGTGLIGRALTKELVQKGYEVIILTRNEPEKSKHPKVSYALWDINAGTIDAGAIAKGDYIIHLAGANVAQKRWTEERKKEIRESRIKSGELLVKALKENGNSVKALISASAIGWYGPDKPNIEGRGRVFVENDPASDDFLGKTCREWEEAIAPVTDLGKRLVILRTGIVLSNEGGAYPEFKKPLHFGLASVLGRGDQIISWIHIDDLVRLYIEAIENKNWAGVYNAVAPNPVTNRRLVLEIAKQRKKIYIPIAVPSFVLKTVLGEMSVEVLKSATVSSEKLEDAGFQFIFRDIGTAVYNLQKKVPQ